MQRLPAWFAWLVVIGAVILAAVMRFWADAGNWVWGLVVVAFLGVGMLLGGDDDETDDPRRAGPI
jgi:hypothetical protein